MEDFDLLAFEVREAAGEIGLSSLRKIAAHIGVDHTLILGIVTYKRRPTPETVTKLADGLGRDRAHWLRLAGYSVVPSEILGDRVRESPAPYSAGRRVTLDPKRFEEALRASGRLSEEDIETVISLIKEAADQGA